MNVNKLNLINVPSHALQSEGAESIVATLLEYGFDGVIIFPAYYTEINENGHWRTPPLLSDFERPVFGYDSVRIERRSPFPHKECYYQNTTVTSVMYKGHEDIWTPFIKHCTDNDLKVVLAMVPLVAFDDVDEFIPRYYDDTPFEEYLGFMCPNHPQVMPFAIGQVRELTERYGSMCDAILLDHIEYPAYSLREVFTCFCRHCKEKARNNGIDVDMAQKEVEGLFKNLESYLSGSQMNFSDALTMGLADGINLAASNHNLFRYLNFKIETISWAHSTISAEIRKLTSENTKPLGNNAFAPTYSLFTGVDYKRIQKYYDFLCPKFYPQHWTKMLNNTVSEVKNINGNIPQEKIINAFMKFVGITNRSFIDDNLQVSSRLADKEAIKSKSLISVPFFPFIHCEGDIRELEVKLEILRKHDIKSAFFHEYMFVGEKKLDLIKNYIEKK